MNQDLESQLAVLKKKYEEVAALKDTEAVQTIEVAFSGEQDQFDSLVEEARRTLLPLSPGVVEALYQQARGEDWYPTDDWDGRLTDDIERRLLRNSEGEISINDSHPQIRPALTALHHLRQFVERKASSDFQIAYEDEHNDELSFVGRGFWERHLT